MSELIIGLTGGIGSGKSTITHYFQELGIEIIDADIIAREVVAINSPALTAIAEHFGDNYLQVDGQLNRSLLRSRIFAHESDKLWLNKLLHPLIRSGLISKTAAAKSPYCILVAPLLIENNLLHLVNRVLVVDVSEATQVTRTILRDNNSVAEVKAILASQTNRAKRLAVADDVIKNDNVSLTEIKKIVLSLDKKYFALTTIL
ncbi:MULTISPECIES: dephospho-CoA kinase [Colwellia]|uniref:Dephospho-CoA kinase n=1 Tax=Colwellia marinimaniae TaxID=1513592 RepID=A0ABQ0MQB5_9GAMM|nr:MULTISPECIES: dephospho-CoA kinase [Colwellia]GAW94523.1 dephospho-CoA kinase [Colwellia marinimaniae]